MHNPGFKEALSEQFAATEVQQIVDFVEKGFSLNGEIVVVSVFLYAKEHGKSLDEVFAVCEAEWTRSWKYQHPDIKGDSDAPGAAGLQNRASLVNIYKMLEIPNPHEESRKIPKESLMVKTSNSTYRIGPANENGERTIARDEKPLTFSRCKITFLAKGKLMRCAPLGSADIQQWTTSCIESITVG